jgi:hypothetical protein
MIREMGADVAISDRPKNGVADGMDQRVGVGMPQKALVIRDIDTAEYKGATFGPSVTVVSNANSSLLFHHFLPNRRLRKKIRRQGT